MTPAPRTEGEADREQLRASFVDRLRRRAGERAFVACAGIDPSPAAVDLLAADPSLSTDRRVTAASRMERFGGMVVEAVRDSAVAIKPQIAWFETAGAPGIRALERVVEHARRAGLLVILDAKRGDIAHSAEAYATAWLGAEASSGICADALTVNASVGSESLAAMARIAHERAAALYALVHTSNLDAAVLQQAELASGGVWWEQVARMVDRVDREIAGSDGGVVGAVVGALHPDVFVRARELMPHAPLLVPGVGAQGGTADDLAPLASSDAPPVLVPTSRSLLPRERMATAGFRAAVAEAATALQRDLDALGNAARVR
jgi:orotidine-5'-phosphate decarboxylase